MKGKPVLFLDFDRTLFDTERYYDWLGEPRRDRNQEIIDGKREVPDLSYLVFPDVKDFLDRMKEKYRLVLLSYVKLDYSPLQARVQKLKIDRSGLAPYFTRIIVTTSDKGEAAADYIAEDDTIIPAAFIDDEEAHLSSIKALFPKMVCLRIDRGTNTGVPLKPKEKEETHQPDFVVSSLEQVTVASIGESKNEEAKTPRLRT